MSGHRKAALALYGLAPEDQHAVLAELPQSDQTVLRNYLAELAELGFEGDAIDTVVSESMSSDPREVLARALPENVVEVLRGEPVAFIVAVVRVQPWPWEKTVLAALPVQVRIRVEARRAEPARAASARDRFVVHAMVQALGRTVKQVQGAPAARSSTNPFRRILAWIR